MAETKHNEIRVFLFRIMLVNIYMILIKKHQNAWQGLWLSWQSIHFLYPQVYGSNPFIDKNSK